MKNWMIKHWLFNYDTKVFGTTFRHLRVVNTLMPLFVFAGLFNLFTEGFGFWDIVVFIPFFAIFFGRNLIIGGYSLDDLDWEQKLQLFQSEPEETFITRQAELKKLKEKWTAKYKGSANFVEAFRFFWPLIFIALALVIFFLFGSNNPEYSDLRGF